METNDELAEPLADIQSPKTLIVALNVVNDPLSTIGIKSSDVIIANPFNPLIGILFAIVKSSYIKYHI